ncbi:hypothetical protein M758_3G039400 [Ceratodon purpureus]|nr:hypothetical protein M758_3G039400 [Ceratodon purpureus]
MEDLASFIQTLSEKYGLLDFGNDKVDTTSTNHPQQKYEPIADEELEDHGHENGDGLGVDTSWECLTSFLNKHDLQYNNMHNFRTKKSTMSKRRVSNGSLPHDDQGDDDVQEAQTLNRPESGSSDRAVSIANTMKTSDLIQNASFLDELQNPSLSEDMQSTGMTKGRDSLDDIDHGQSSLLQEFLTGNGDKDVDVLEIAKEMGLSSFNECPQKEADAPWHANSGTWFREFCSTRNNVTISSKRSVRVDTKVAKEVCLDRGLSAHDILASNDILLSSGSSSSPTGTVLDGQVEDCHSASASQCGADATVDRSRCASPEGFAAALESVERGRERAAMVNARVEKMLEDSDSHHRRPVHHAAENVGGKSINRVREDNLVAEEAGKLSESRSGTSDNGSVGSLKKRITDMGEGNRLLLNQLDKSRSLLSPSKQPTLFRSRSSASDRSETWRQTRRSSEELGDRSEHDDNIPHRQLDEGGSTMLSRRSKEKGPSPNGPDSLSRASSRGEPDYKPDSRASSIHEEETCAKASSHYSGQRRASSRNQEMDHQPCIASPVDQLHRVHTKRDLSGDRHRSGRNLRIRIPNFQPPADQYDPRNADGQDPPENQEGIYGSRETLAQDHQNQYGFLAVSPRNKQNDDHEEIREGREKFEAGQPGLVHSGQNCSNDEGLCAKTKEYFNFTSSWGNDWTEVEEEVIEETDPAPSKTSVGQSKWERVNNLLCQNGFPTIRSSNIPASDFEEDCHLVLSDVVSNYERREKFVQALLDEGDELRQVEERNHLHIQQLESERDEANQKLAASERRADVAAKTAERNYAALRRDCQKLELSNANLMQRCSQLEHACRAKERTLQKLQDKVRESMVKEDRHRNNDKEVYEKLKHKIASAQHTNGEVLEPNFLNRDLKPAQIVGIYERQKVALESEISNLRAENAQLCREICEKENIILNRVLGTEETKKALDLLSRKQQMQIDEKVKEINRLEDELKERPTMEEVEETIRSASRQEEESRQFHEQAQDESYFEKILSKICQLLELDEPSFIVETLESLLVLVSAVPRMEQFVSDVCDVVFCDGQNWSPPSNDEDAGANRTPEAVPAILKSWLQKLEESSELLSFKDTIVGMLWGRGEKNSELEPESSCRVVIGCVKNLIDVEQDYLATKASYSDAGAIVKAEPQKLLHRIVAHFQMLFEVPKLEGVMTVMNSVYIKCTEYHNFARALSSMLGLEKEEGPNTIISTLNSMMSNGRM